MKADLKHIRTRFPEPLDMRFLIDDEFYLLTPFEYISEKWGHIVSPAHELTDGATIPRWLWVIVGSPWSGRYPRAAVIHDKLCKSQGHIPYTQIRMTKKEVDQLFLEMMKFLGVKFYKRQKMYRAVRLNRGKFEWEKNS